MFVQCVLGFVADVKVMCRYGGYGQDWWGHGIRNIIFSSPDAKGSLQSWIRYENGTVHANVTLDASYQ